MGIDNHKGKWRIRFMRDGNRYTLNTGLKAIASNRKAAEKMEAELRLTAALGKPRGKDLAVPKAIDQYLDWAKGELKHSTYLAHRTGLASVRVYFEGKTLRQVAPGDIEEYKAWRRTQGISPNTLLNNLGALSRLFRWAKKHHYRMDNPVREVDRPKAENVRGWYILSKSEEAEYLGAAKARSVALHDLACLMLGCGIRPEEGMRIRVEDVDGEILHIRKGKSAAARRDLWLPPHPREILQRRVRESRKAGSPWVFPSPRYDDRHLTKLNNPHDEVCRDIGLSFVLYDLRHTFATRCAQSGMDLATLASVLGHSGLRVVQKYVHPTPQHQILAMQAAHRKCAQQTRSRDKSPAKGDNSSPDVRQKKGKTNDNENGRKHAKH